jgi:hypothetical protein
MRLINDQAFRQHLAIAVPSITWANMAQAPTVYLRELYPNIWQYGPRGDIYAVQLQTLLTALDGYFTLPSTSGISSFIRSHLPNFNEALDISRYANRPDIEQAVVREQRPKYPFPFLDDQRNHPIFHSLRRHPVFANTPTDNFPLMEQLLINFTYHSLYRDIIARDEGNAKILTAWKYFCDVWRFEVY